MRSGSENRARGRTRTAERGPPCSTPCFFSKDGYYIFRAMCPVGETAVYDPLFSNVLKSFKVVEAEGSPAR
ncbi:MAG: hypothetical protein VCA35_06190 [Roseibacillus sp.]